MATHNAGLGMLEKYIFQANTQPLLAAPFQKDSRFEGAGFGGSILFGECPLLPASISSLFTGGQAVIPACWIGVRACAFLDISKPAEATH